MFGWSLGLGTALAAEPNWHLLRSPEATASSFLASNWNKFQENYHPTYVLDENPATAWVEGAEGDGLGEWLVLPISSLSSARTVRLKIRNGYQKSETLLAANAAPKDVTIELLDRGRAVVSHKAMLERKMGWQEVTIAVPTGRGFDAARLRIDSVTPGRTYKDTCISDVLIEVDTDVPYAEQVEAGKKAAAVTWIKSRVEMAKQFAAGGFQTPFAATQYQCDNQEPPPSAAEVEAQLAPARSWKERVPATGPTYRADPVSKIPEPDGTWDYRHIAYLLRTDLAAFFEAEKGRLDAPAKESLEVNFWSGRQWTAMRLAGPPTAPSAGFVSSHETFYERSTTVRDAEWTFVWSEGRLQGLFVRTVDVEDYAPVFESGKAPPKEQGGAETLLVPHWTPQGAIDRWEGWSKGRWTSECEGDDCNFARHWVCAGR